MQISFSVKQYDDDTVALTVLGTMLESGSCTLQITHLQDSTRQALFLTFYTQEHRHSEGSLLKSTHIRSSSCVWHTQV